MPSYMQFSDNYLKEDSVCFGALAMVDSCQFIFGSNMDLDGFKRSALKFSANILHGKIGSKLVLGLERRLAGAWQ